MSDASSKVRPLSRIFETLPEAYFKESAETFVRALAATGNPREIIIDLAGMRICLRFAGEVPIPLIMPTLNHLVSEKTGPVDLTICCWDDETTRSEMRLPTPRILTDQRRNCLHTVSDRRFRAYYHEWMNVLCDIDLQDHVAYYCYLNAASMPMYEIAAPMRQIFNEAFNQRGKQLVHAAAVGSSQGSVLLAGAAKSGKSTLAVQCLLHGMDYQSDDLCVISQESPRSWSIYNIAKLRENSVARLGKNLPKLSHFTEGEEKKSFFYAHQHFPEKVLKEVPIKALVIPMITNGATSRLTKATRIDAARALVPWSTSEVPTSDPHPGEKIMLKAINQLPSYKLEVGRDERQTVDLLRKLIDESQ